MDIPVVGSVEAGLAVSQFIGARVGVITINPPYTDIIRRNIRRYGHADRLVGPDAVRSFDLSWDAVAAALAGDPDRLVAPFEPVMEGLIRDGADVILGGGQSSARSWTTSVTSPGPSRSSTAPRRGSSSSSRSSTCGSPTGLRTTNAASSPFRRVPDDVLDASYAALYGVRSQSPTGPGRTTEPRPSTSTACPGAQAAMSCASSRRRRRRIVSAGRPRRAGMASSRPR